MMRLVTEKFITEQSECTLYDPSSSTRASYFR